MQEYFIVDVGNIIETVYLDYCGALDYITEKWPNEEYEVLTAEEYEEEYEETPYD